MPDKNFWDQRYLDGLIQWDAGSITTPLKEYFDQLENKAVKILIPGAGNAHEAEFLFKKGFSNVSVLDISDLPLKNIKSRIPAYPIDQLIQKDFFDFEGKFDLIIEQTFFCALDPSLRPAYAKKMYDLLLPGGKLVGLLFDDQLNTDKPPFGGTKDEYISYFRDYFRFQVFEKAYNSIEPRAGRELFMILDKV